MNTTHDYKIFSRANWVAVIVIGLVPPLLFFLEEITVYGSAGTKSLADLAIAAAFSLLVTILLYFGTTWIIVKLHDSIPWQRRPLRRLVIEAIGVLTYAAVAMTLATVAFHRLVVRELDFAMLLYSNLIIALTITVIVVAIWEGRYFLKQWKTSLVHAEKLQKEMAETQYEALKNQVNPHFLFNSLNALSTLVHKDADKAEAFIRELSKIYRYVLEKNKHSVATVKEELDFLKSYFFLQQIRFGENLNVEVTVPAEVLNRFIPSLALQMLAENAVKHNEISAARPLHVQIFSDNGFLVMKNELQLRDEKPESTGLGLRNLSSRYETISELKPEFVANGKFYMARIPLIAEE
jgi:hypothetical protein